MRGHVESRGDGSRVIVARVGPSDKALLPYPKVIDKKRVDVSVGDLASSVQVTKVSAEVLVCALVAIFALTVSNSRTSIGHNAFGRDCGGKTCAEFVLRVAERGVGVALRK